MIEPTMIARWDWDATSAYRHSDPVGHRARAQYLTHFFGDVEHTPALIWRVEFFEADEGGYFLRVYQYARDEDGKRHRAWVKAHDIRGHAEAIALVAVMPPWDAPFPLGMQFPSDSVLQGTPL